jgi:glycosyltransferase involved in cell wall biosynthesis
VVTPISAILAARNEESHIEQTVRSLAAQPEIAEIIVVNDQSTDRTGEILAGLTRELPQLRVFDVAELPEGWVGKNHALWLGAQAARGEWLLFTDADVTHLPGSAARALADAAASDAALVSYSPEQETHTWWERAMIPFVFCRLERHFRYGRLEDAYSAPAANGQYILVRRDAYFAFGGHRAIGGEVLEDVAMARCARNAGFKIHFDRGAGIARTRMYRSFGQMWEGWRKNLYSLVGGTAWGAFREMAGVFPWWAVIAIAFGAVHPVLVIFGLPWLLREHMVYAARLRTSQRRASDALYYVPAVFLYSAALVASAAAHARGRVAWKGREYPIQARQVR